MALVSDLAAHGYPCNTVDVSDAPEFIEAVEFVTRDLTDVYNTYNKDQPYTITIRLKQSGTFWMKIMGSGTANHDPDSTWTFEGSTHFDSVNGIAEYLNSKGVQPAPVDVVKGVQDG